MAKQDILNAIKEKNEKLSKEVIADLFDAIFAELSKVDRTRVPGFGTFSSRVRAARTGFKPNTKEPINIAEKKTLVFKIAADFKTELNPAPVAPVKGKTAAKAKTAAADTKAKPAAKTTTKAAAKEEPKAAPAKAAAKVEAPKAAAKVEAPKAAAKVEAPKAAAKVEAPKAAKAPAKKEAAPAKVEAPKATKKK
jgi:nucleoid DNA-binding protein